MGGCCSLAAPLWMHPCVYMWEEGREGAGEAHELFHCTWQRFMRLLISELNNEKVNTTMDSLRVQLRHHNSIICCVSHCNKNTCQFRYITKQYESKYSSLGLGWETEVWFLTGADIFLVTITLRLPMGSTQFPIQIIAWPLLPGHLLQPPNTLRMDREREKTCTS